MHGPPIGTRNVVFCIFCGFCARPPPPRLPCPPPPLSLSFVECEVCVRVPFPVSHTPSPPCLGRASAASRQHAAAQLGIDSAAMQLLGGETAARNMTEPDRQAAVKEIRQQAAQASALAVKDAKQGQVRDFARATGHGLPVQGRRGSKEGRAVLPLPCSNPQHATATGGFRLGHRHRIGSTTCGAGGQQVRGFLACRVCLLFPP